jgi:predicted permease
METHKDQKLLIISCLFLVLFTFPVLSIFNSESSIKGIPVLYLYIFIVWILFIIIIFRVIKKESKEIKKDE